MSSGLSQHTIGGTPRTAMTTLKAWEISPTSSFAPAPFNSGPPKSATDVEDYLSEAFDPQRRQETRLFRIESQHSRDHIDTETGVLKALLDHIDAFPALHNVLGAFHRDMMDSQNGKAAAHYSHHHSSTTKNPLLELCYLLKYVETHGRPSPPVWKAREGYCQVQRWSVRQMAFYQSFHADRQFETALLVNPSIQLVHDLRHQYKKSSTTPAVKPYENWMQLPQLIFESLPANWSEYTSALYRAVEEVYNDAYFTDPRQPRIDEADSHSLQTCSELMDRLQQADHVLGNNITILQTALQIAQQRASSSSSSSSASSGRSNHNTDNDNLSTFIHSTTETLTTLQFHRTHLHLITSRLSQTFTSIHNLIQLRSSHNMEHMTERTILEARAVRLIALVTLFFIPPTFTAGFLQMGGLNFDASTRGHMVITVEAKFLFFVAITVPLMVVVMGASWVGYNWCSVRRWGGGGRREGRRGGKDGDGDRDRDRDEKGGGSEGV